MGWKISLLVHLRTAAQLYIELAPQFQYISARFTSPISMIRPRTASMCLSVIPETG